jgi:hypothetical protein
MTAADIKRKIGRAAGSAAGAVLGAADVYRRHPFAVTFRLLTPPVVWLLLAVGALVLITWGETTPADPVQSWVNGIGDGVLIGASATVGTYGVLRLLRRAIARRGRSK